MGKDWKKVALTPEKTIKEALLVINQEALRIALVVDDCDVLLGIVTDGDIRRGLLNNYTLDDSISTVMNTSPLTSKFGVNRNELIALMEKANFLAIPLLLNNKVVGLETLHRSTVHAIKENPIFIMAGGFGTRLRPLTDNCPKPMLKVGGKPILETIINSFKKLGFINFYISTHYLPEVIHDYFGNGEKHNINITYINEDKPLGTGGALGLLPNTIPKLPIIMVNGDILTNVNFEKLLDFHNKNTSVATMCVREYEYTVPYGVINGDDNKILSMVEKPTYSCFVNAGIYVVGHELAQQVKANVHIDMPTLLENEISKNNSVLRFPIHEYWLDIGRLDDFMKAQDDIYSLGLID